MSEESSQGWWSGLNPSLARDQELVARYAARSRSTALMCAIGADDMRQFLVAVEEDDQDLIDDRSRGLRVTTRSLEVSGEPARRYVVIQCSDRSAHDLFDVFGRELLQALQEGGAARVTVERIVDRWRSFWSDVPRKMMRVEELAGLFGELWFLHVWLAPALGLASAMRVWRGPFGTRHDFESKRFSVEVKTTLNQSHRVHRINGIEQLEPPDNGGLALFSVRVRQEVGATNSVPALVGLISESLKDSPTLSQQFELALEKVGYVDALRAHYLGYTFRVVDCSLYEVLGAFPRLTRAQLDEQKVPVGVSDIEYSIHLTSYADVLADAPAAARSFLARAFAGEAT